MIRTLVSSFVVLAALTACGPADFTGAYSATGESVWTLQTSADSTGRMRFPVGGQVAVSNSMDADYKLTVDGCSVDLTLQETNTAAVVPGATCVYEIDGTRAAEVYRAGTLTATADESATFFAIGDVLAEINGNWRQLGSFRIDLSLRKTSEWPSDAYEARTREAAPKRTGTWPEPVGR